ncbi:MAG: aldo/keto reductase [Lachnospiraceae bacterium]|nr:aldo/keto reductase [Lachnospiraceae bacterium]
MKVNTLGNTGIKISELGYGCAALFGKNVIGKQGLSEEDAFRIIKTAFENGINFFDTGFNYGYAEERLGRILSRLFEQKMITRNDIVIETKCGETLNENGTYGGYDWSSDWIKKSVEISLKRMNIDYIDLLAMHGGTPEDCTDKLINTFENLKAEGVIRAYGVNTFDDTFLDWICKKKCFDYVMLDYNIMKQHREDIIQRMYENGIGILAGMALGQALFAKKKIKNRNDLWYWLRAFVNFRNNMQRGKDFRFLTKQEGFSGNQLALRYVLDNPYVSSAVFSTISIEHLRDDLSAVNIEMPDSIRRAIKDRA